MAGYFQHVLETFGNQQSDGGALVFQNRIGGDGGAMQDVDYIGGADAIGRQNLGETGHKTQGWVDRRGRGFVHPLFIRFQVAEHDIGKSTAYVHGYCIGSHILPCATADGGEIGLGSLGRPTSCRKQLAHRYPGRKTRIGCVLTLLPE